MHLDFWESFSIDCPGIFITNFLMAQEGHMDRVGLSKLLVVNMLVLESWYSGNPLQMLRGGGGFKVWLPPQRCSVFLATGLVSMGLANLEARFLFSFLFCLFFFFLLMPQPCEVPLSLPDFPLKFICSDNFCKLTM